MNEVLEVKLLVGKSGYDLIFLIVCLFVDCYIKVKFYWLLDKSKLYYYGNIDLVILKLFVDIDLDNVYLVFYMWGIIGIGYNIDKVIVIFGKEMLLDIWKLLFDLEIVVKLSVCGVVMMDDFIEVLVVVCVYLGKDSEDFSIIVINEVAVVISKVCFKICYFYSL